MIRTPWACGLCCLAFAAGPVGAAEGWEMPSLNPFRSSSAAAPAAAQDDGGFKLPKLDLKPGSEKPARARSTEPSAWSKMTTGTKDFFGKSYDVLTPWDTEAEKAKSRREASMGRKKVPKKSFLTSWMSDDPPPQKPKTVSQFLAQPRPE